MAQSQCVLIRCLYTLILKAWRPLRGGASSIFNCRSEFKVLTYQWGNDRAIVTFDRTGRSKESRNKWLSNSWCLVLGLGLSTGVSWAGQEAEVGALLGVSTAQQIIQKAQGKDSTPKSEAVGDGSPPISDRACFWTLSRCSRWQAAVPDHTSGQ